MPEQELGQLWNAHPEWHTQEHRAGREAALPELLELIEDFRAGRLDIATFRQRVDSHSKRRESGLWGFRGNAGVMFFTMLVKGAGPELEVLLRRIIVPPSDVEEARASIDQLRQLARETKARTGNKNLHERFVPFFLSFFWEAQDRDRWPMFHPASRDGLQQVGLLSAPDDVTDAYVAFRETMQELCTRLGVDIWDLEQFLWSLKQDITPPQAAQSSPQVTSSPAPSAAGDLYTALAAAGLQFPEGLVTTFILSLLTKRFVILAGISGTGKTQLPLRLAHHLAEQGRGETVAGPVPESDEHHLYLEVTASTLRYGGLTVPRRFADLIELPERGTGMDFTVSLPDGRDGRVRIQNVGFSDEAARYARLTIRGVVKEWLTEVASVGDIVEVAIDENGTPRALAHQSRTHVTASEPLRRHELIAVRSDWTDARGLTGYWNPLTNRYAMTPLIRLCLRAAADPEHPYLVILDEMNLARVEYYFSDFLSALESGEPIALFDEAFEDSEPDVPPSLTIPDNILFVGTVNVDETTHAFSPKVLDRANVIEFDEVDIKARLDLGEPTPAPAFRLADGHIAPRLLAERPPPDAAMQSAVFQDAELTADLLRIHAILEEARRHFGYRVLDELTRYLGHAVQRVEGEAGAVARAALDLQLLQKVLPKLTGGRELQDTLTKLLDVCVSGETTAAPSVSASLTGATAALGDEAEAMPSAATPAGYPRSARKLQRMVQRLEQTGYVTFLE